MKWGAVSLCMSSLSHDRKPPAPVGCVSMRTRTNTVSYRRTLPYPAGQSKRLSLLIPAQPHKAADFKREAPERYSC